MCNDKRIWTRYTAVMSKPIKSVLRGLAVENLISVIVFGQLAAFILARFKPEFVQKLGLFWPLVLEGEVWRVVTFLFVPPATSLIFIAFALYLLYLYGQALEASWGSGRFTLFILTSWATTVLVSFFFPMVIVSNYYIMLSIFLAFARLNPDFVLHLFFVLPVKIKYLAWLSWAFIAYGLFTGDWPQRAFILAGVSNYGLFFFRSWTQAAQGRSRRQSFRVKQIDSDEGVTHRCSVCGISSRDNADLDFRYCSECVGTPCFCMQHLKEHEHTKSSSSALL